MASAAVFQPACGDDAVGTPSPASGATVAEALCASLADGLATEQACGAASACDGALVQDCSVIVSTLSDSFMQGVIDCMDGGETFAACLWPAFSSASATPAHDDFAASFCANCALGVPGCETLFSAEAPDALAPVRQLLLALGEDVVGELTATCTEGLTCGAEFQSCAQGVLIQRAIPEATLTCLLDTLMNPSPVAPTGCGTGDGAGGGDGGDPGGPSDEGSGAAGSGAGGGTSAGTGGAGNAGSGAGNGGTGGAGAGCGDWDFEPNDDEEHARAEPLLTDCLDAAVAYGVVAGAEEDWFTYAGEDSFCVVNPTVALDTTALEVCQYFECAADPAGTEVDCPAGTTTDTSSGGRAGCCDSGPFTASVNCPGLSDDVQVFVRVRDPSADPNTCVEYELTYSY